MKQIFKQIIADFHTTHLKTWKSRDIIIPLDTKKIISIIWPRRSGKSFLLYNIISLLIHQWIAKENIVYINFEDERLDVSSDNLHSIIDAYFELYHHKQIEKVYFFFDEIQNIDWREKFIRRIYDNWVENIFITWSNAKLLSKEIATSLRWRSVSFEVLPLSFQEFIRFKSYDSSIYSTVWKATILSLQKEYLTWGGFPEILSFEESLKIKTLQEYFDVMLYNDIIERYKIKDTTLLKYFVKQLLQTTTKEFSINKIGNNLKALWLRFDKNILYEFVDYLDTIYFGKSVSKFDYALSKQTLKKFYLFDNGYLNAISFSFSDNYWKLLENAVFVELYRRHGEHIFFLKNWSETDFVVHLKDNIIYQVCHTLTEENRKREYAGCIDAMHKFSISQAYIITNEQEETITLWWNTLYIIPFYKWIIEHPIS